MISDPLLLLAFMFAVVAFTRFLEKRFTFVERISSAVVCTLLGITFANIGVIPTTVESATNATVFEFAVPYTIVLVIIGTNVREIITAGKPLVLAYLMAVFGSFAGGLACGVLMNAWVGPETWKLSGAFAGAFAGGGMNFAAVGQGLEIPSSTFAAAAVADNLSTVPWLLAQVGLVGVLSGVFLKRMRPGSTDAEAQIGSEGSSGSGGSGVDVEAADLRKEWTVTELSITEMSALAGIPLAVLWLARQLGQVVPGIPEVLWLTTIALVLSQLPIIRKLRGAQVASYFSLHMFFIVLGASSVVAEVFEAGISIFVFMIAIIAVHALVVYGLGWLARLDLPTISVASQAAIGGPGSALALSMAMKWDRLVTPGVIVGIFGYALGNYLGFACSYLVRMLL
jgi:uncharacterized membrane protein